MSGTPNTGDVRTAYGQIDLLTSMSRGDTTYQQTELWRERMAEFDRWLAEHDRQISAEAWEDGRQAGLGQDFDPFPSNPYHEPDQFVAHAHGCRLPSDHDGGCVTDTPHQFGSDGCEHCKEER